MKSFSNFFFFVLISGRIEVETFGEDIIIYKEESCATEKKNSPQRLI